MGKAKVSYEHWKTAKHWSRCSAGKRGWFWVVNTAPSFEDPGAVYISGFEATMEEAESRAREIAGKDAVQDAAKWAELQLKRRRRGENK